jgi:hypothetical protein
MKKNLNVEIYGYKIDDVAEKIGSLFGDAGRTVGKAIDDMTKNVTIKISSKNGDKYKEMDL